MQKGNTNNKMKLFISDLDNTLIYSYKRNIGTDRVLVETMGEKELSFMTGSSYRMLRLVKEQYCFVPVTTRSLEQYRRICFANDWIPEYALTSNGGNLLYKNKIDVQWYEASLRLIADAEEELEKAVQLLKDDKKVSFEVRKVDGLFVFTKSDDVFYTMEKLREKLDMHMVEVFHNGTKVYVLPKKLNKGEAVKRIKEYTAHPYAVAAGDSEFDIPMLLEADFAFYPKELGIQKDNGISVDSKKEIFSDVILNTLLGDAEKKDVRA